VRVNLQPAFVLHSRPYRDTSAMLDVLTAEYGRISLVARGARRQARKGSEAARLQPFSPLLVSFSGRAEMKTLTSSEAAGGALPLRGERLYSALYLNELLVRLLHRNDPHPRLFAGYGAALEDLSDNGSMELALRRFELLLIDELGYSFDLSCDAATGELIDPARQYCFDPGLGLVADHGPVASGRTRYRGEDIQQIAAGRLDGTVRLPARSLLREVLSVHLGDRPLRSRELFLAHKAGRGRTQEGTT